jgi:hypothetical protein
VYNNAAQNPGGCVGIAYKTRVGGTWHSAHSLVQGGSFIRDTDPSGKAYWGDYAGSAPDPDGHSSWIFTEFAGSANHWNSHGAQID